MVKQRGSINTAGDSLTFSPTVISSTSTLTCVYLCTGADKSRKMSDKRAFRSKSSGSWGGGVALFPVEGRLDNRGSGERD